MAKKSLFYLLFFSGLTFLIFLIMQPLTILQFTDYISVLFPEGLIGIEQRNLLLIIQALMLFVIVPVYILTFVFSWRYRANNPEATYDPDLVDNKIAEYIWWGFPLVMTAIIGAITWVKTYQLDPYSPIASPKKEITIQVVALQWKWLFIYPEEKIATVNFVQIPQDTPIRFEITADAPMNSFWIPELGGQIYAMPKMKTTLYLIGNTPGQYRGVSANLSGEGFAGMHFIARVLTEEEYKNWIASAQKTTDTLDWNGYKSLAAPSYNNPVATYRLQEGEVFSKIISKYMHPQRDQ